ncbi:ribosomal protection-like ABC-F family protein [Tenggerimyces flavus]|uniref:Ribosomal protection-like ABC-F family protein n=1 Tax=Tenggerimyces flavus TaxID=1708749 RepID=A0ABV7YER2_9ACTN|nr:ABC-F family ATP-binding cassette domain-containing protein [Tenggerimyces flavus]MBM7787124.1 macrolide transport system ATP-binding/permease protein [Tenggerimyces flavus]
MRSQLTLRHVSKSYADRLVLDDVSLTITPGEHVGIVGENGAGKSTLLRLIAGQEPPDDGELLVAADGVGHLAQIIDLPPETTVLGAIDSALADLRAIERRLQEVGEDQVDEYAELLAAFELRGGYDADARVAAAMHGLGIGDLPHERSMDTLSGGEQSRLALACLIAAASELMLLDEPTNHLDDAALDWLETHLRAHRGTVVAVSHDRTFLERVATALLEIDADRHVVQRYGNGYEGFLKEKAAERQRWEQSYAVWCADLSQQELRAATTARRVGHNHPIKDRNKMDHFGMGQRVQHQVSSRVRNAEERIRRLRADPVPRPPEPLAFTAKLTAEKTDRQLLQANGLRIAGRLEVDDLALEAGDRLLIHGPNGAGKTTLLRVLAGTLVPEDGEVERNASIGVLGQQIEFTDDRRSALATFAGGRPGTREEFAERLLRFGLFRTADLRKPVGTLSVGQRRRLALARVLDENVDLLLLDEPTNHLSPALVEELEAALQTYEGAVVVVTHDRLLRRRFPGPQREMRAGRLAAAA